MRKLFYSKEFEQELEKVVKEGKCKAIPSEDWYYKKLSDYKTFEKPIGIDFDIDTETGFIKRIYINLKYTLRLIWTFEKGFIGDQRVIFESSEYENKIKECIDNEDEEK